MFANSRRGSGKIASKNLFPLSNLTATRGQLGHHGFA